MAFFTLVHVFYGNNEDLFVRVIPSKHRILTVLTVRKISATLKYIPVRSLRLYLYILEKDVFVNENIL